MTDLLNDESAVSTSSAARGPRATRRLLIILGAAVVLAIGGVAAAIAVTSDSGTPLQKAVAGCDITEREGVELGGGGTSVSMIVDETGMTGVPMGNAMCVLRAAGIPDHLEGVLRSTKAGSSPLEKDWNGYDMTVATDGAVRIELAAKS